MNILQTVGAPRAMTKIILIGSFTIAGLLTTMLGIGYFIFHNTYVLTQIITSLSAITYLAITGYIIARQRIKLAAWMLILLYAFIAVSILHFGV